MKEAIQPFIRYCFLQFFVGIMGLNIVGHKRIGVTEALKSWVFGQMLMFAILQVMAVPMVLFRWKFNVLFWSYTVVCIAIFGFGCRRLWKVRWKTPDRKKWTLLSLILLIAVLIIIGIQFHKYLFMMHLDEDDARWLAEANDALVYGDMMTRSIHTGEYLGYFDYIKDITSPWALFFAVLSKVLMIRTAVFAHTIYASTELLLMYGIYWLISRELFRNKESEIAFLFYVSIINCFFAGTVYTQSVFSLIRIWQGKATVAAVIIPAIFYLFIRINRVNKIEDWLLVCITGTAASLMSGMGISIAIITNGIFGTYSIVTYKRWERIPVMLLSLVFPITFGLIYSFLKG